MHNARAGLLAGNTILWRCSAYDLDVSDRVIFEDNVVKCTERGVVPHGNSISGYDYPTHPSSRYWSVARNRYSRPAYHKGTEQNWIQRETITTDGPGAFGMGKIVTMSGTNVTLSWLAWVHTPLVGATLVVLDGPGRGQHRLVTGVGSFNGTVELDAPLDDWVSASNTVAVLASLGSKLIIGNRFNWTEVVQWYGNTLRGVMADNSFHHCNVKSGGNINVGSMGGVGECYHGTSQMFFTEFRANTLQSSDGISLVDNFNRGEWQCAPYGGPWVAWSAIRNNTLGGISEASRNRSAGGSDLPMCAFISVQGGGSEVNGYTSDVVAEGNVFECPPEGNNSIQYRIRDCRHCSQR